MTEHPIYDEAVQLMGLHGLTQDGWRFELSMHKTFVGMCYYDRKVIAYSAFFLNESPASITDVLLHEIAHALAGHQAGHGEHWKEVARSIGCSAMRCSEAAPVPSYNYVIRCVPCGKEWKRYRLRKSMHSASCPDCGKKVSIFKITRKEA